MPRQAAYGFLFHLVAVGTCAAARASCFLGQQQLIALLAGVLALANACLPLCAKAWQRWTARVRGGLGFISGVDKGGRPGWVSPVDLGSRLHWLKLGLLERLLDLRVCVLLPHASSSSE